MERRPVQVMKERADRSQPGSPTPEAPVRRGRRTRRRPRARRRDIRRRAEERAIEIEWLWKSALANDERHDHYQRALRRCERIIAGKPPFRRTCCEQWRARS